MASVRTALERVHCHGMCRGGLGAFFPAGAGGEDRLKAQERMVVSR